MNSKSRPFTGDSGSYVTMFGGKGGVGKTTCAGAMALHHASQKEKTLIISTDPAPSLSHIFEIKSDQKPAKVIENLYLSELGLEEIKGMWDRKFGREVYEVFSSLVSISYDEFVDFFTSILPGIRDEFMVNYIKEFIDDENYQQIVWDTAPLGQTLGLLKTPTMLREHLKPAPRIYSKLRLGGKNKKSILDIIKGWEEISLGDINFLKSRVRFVIVTIPEALAVQQLDEIFREFENYEFKIERLIINNVVPESDSDFLHTKREQQQRHIEFLRHTYQNLNMIEVPMFSQEIKGVERLRKVEEVLFGLNKLSPKLI